ncbi:uncharacterized protein METZ01_LOCUS503990, partial [marine metagenome]
MARRTNVNELLRQDASRRISPRCRNFSPPVAICACCGSVISAGSSARAVDLDLDIDTRVQPSPIPTVELAQHLDVHFISHWHGDHFSSTTNALLAELSDCLFVLPADCVDKAHEIGIPNERIHIVRPDEPFELPGRRQRPSA